MDKNSQPRRQPLKNAEKEHHEINRKAQATDQSVTSLMGELQDTEAKQADLKHTISENEAEIDRIASRLENQKKQIEKIETTTIPMKYQVCVDGGIGQLTKEIGTDLISTLLEEDHGMLAQLSKRFKWRSLLPKLSLRWK
jgi:chromosome segregation ATPase